MSKTKLIPYLEALFAVMVWGASFIATKVALQEVSPVTIVWLRFTIGVVVLGLAVLLRKQLAPPDRKEWLYFALLGFLGITFHQWLQSNGLKTSEASTTAWIVSTTPIFMALLGWLVLKEKLGWLKTSGILLAFAGVMLVVSRGELSTISIGKLGKPGDFLILVSAINWAVFSALSRRGLKSHPASLMMFYLMLLGWVFTSIWFLTSSLILPGTGFSEIFSLSQNGWGSIAFLGVFCSGLAYIAWYDALQVLSTAQTGVFLYLEPLFAIVVAAIVLGEQITLASILGGAVILFGVWLVNKS